ncbi:MAG: hypothetical protein LKE40_09450 [Spirochaetia bacterium]|jgi:hypothetical protein|nr:hypothetical protein [Spirochaetia bacterium]
MNKLIRKAIFSIQTIIAAVILFAIASASILLFREHISTFVLPETFLPIFIREIIYVVVAFQLLQLSPRNVDLETQSLHILLLCLSLDGLIVLPSFQQVVKINLIPMVFIAEVHLFCLIFAALLFFLIALFRNEVNTKTNAQYILFALIFSLVIVKITPISSPTTTNIWLPLVPQQKFNILFTALMLVALLTLNPFSWKSYSRHGKIKFISYTLLMLATFLARFEFVNLFFGNLLSVLFLLVGSFLLIQNIRTYRI